MPSNFTSKRNPAYVNLVDESATSIGTEANPVHVIESGGTPPQGFGTLYDGTHAATTTAAPLAATQAISKVLVQNDPASTVNLLVGNATSQSMKVVPGANIEIEVNDLAKVFVKTSSGTATANYLAGGA